MKKEKGCFPQTLHDAIKYFADEEKAFEFMKHIRWPDGVVKCPSCGSTNISFLSTRKVWKCKNVHPKQQFSVKVGTVLEDSAIALEKWLCAFWLIANAKNGISSYELHRSIGVTQKTAWFMLQRIRLAMQDTKGDKLKGRVEADETFVGAKARNIHRNKRPKHMMGTVGKTAVLGLLQRNAPNDGVSPFALRLDSNNNLLIDAILVQEDGVKKIYVENGELHNRPPWWDTNWSDTAFEVVNADRKPLLQLMYTDAAKTTIQITGFFVIDGTFLGIESNRKRVSKKIEDFADFKLSPIFKYPSRDFRGVYVDAP